MKFTSKNRCTWFDNSRAKSEFAASDNVKYHLMETLRRMTIFVIGTLGVLILVLMEGDY